MHALASPNLFGRADANSSKQWHVAPRCKCLPAADVRCNTIGYLNGDNIIFKEDSVKIGTCPKVREIKIIYKEETKKKP